MAPLRGPALSSECGTGGAVVIRMKSLVGPAVARLLLMGMLARSAFAIAVPDSLEEEATHAGSGGITMTVWMFIALVFIIGIGVGAYFQRMLEKNNETIVFPGIGKTADSR